MTAIIFPTTTAPGFKPAEGGGRLINAIAEKLQGGGPSDYVIRRVPGLERIAVTGTNVCRGILEVDGAAYVVQGTRCFRVTSNGDGTYSAADIGEILGDGKVYMARNNKTPTPDVLCVTTAAVYLLSASAVSELNEADLPQPNSVTFLDTYFFFSIADGRIFASSQNGTTVNALDFTTAEARPDGLLRVVAFRNELFAFGQHSIQPYYNAANPEGFPFAPHPMIPRGLIAQNAVAGAEPGWSNELIWVADDSNVYILNGYKPQVISTHDIARMITAVEDKSTLEASVYMAGGHAIWALSSPDWTLEYNLSTGFWNERKSYGRERWQASCSAFAFGRWIVGSAFGDALYAVDDTRQREHNDQIVWTVVSAQGTGWPNRFVVSHAHFNFVSGWGIAPGEDPIQTDPVVMISYSKDSGNTWSDPMIRKLGKQGEYSQRVRVGSAGMCSAKGIQWKVWCSDPVYVALLGGDMTVVPRAA